ncbi:MAG: hypothetical protein WAK11_14335 [Candidatus Cybelea sp.]
MRIQSVACLCILVFAGLTGQTPPPAAAPSAPPAAAPLRHLEYTFVVDHQGMSERHFNGIGNGVQTSNGVRGISSSNGGHGTMDVDVLSIAADGALVVRISESVYLEARPRQPYTCTVYGDTAVTCPSVPAPSEAEWVLLSYLGRQFVEAAPWDAQHHWQRKAETAQYSLQEDFTLSDTGDGKRVLIHETKKTEIHDGGFSTRSEDLSITYDRSMEVPDAIEDELVSSGGGGSGHSSFDFQLSKDSFVKQ